MPAVRKRQIRKMSVPPAAVAAAEVVPRKAKRKNSKKGL
jgi:hypothetical protein